VRAPRTTAAAACLLVLLPLLGACAQDQDAYCSAVEEHQEELTRIASDGERDSLLRALEIFRDLESRAPGDISDEWQQVVGRIEDLDAALRAADVDPTTYDRKHPPADLGDEDRTRIDAAARELGSAATRQALLDLDQQARDVCHTPLSL
jgi:hypothetical protein